MTLTRIVAGILAGGQGARFGGVDKGWVERDGCAQIERVLDAVAANRAALQTSGGAELVRVMVSANRSVERYAALGLDVVEDRWPGFPGPMAGIASLLLALRSRVDEADVAAAALLTVPVDHANLPADFTCRMLDAASTSDDVIVAADDDGPQPLFALYPLALADTIIAAFEAGERSIHRWQQARSPRICRFAALRFGNLNSPTDSASQ